MSNWQPIGDQSSARASTMVDLWGKFIPSGATMRVVNAYWNKQHGSWWLADHARFLKQVHKGFLITHWMPVPEAPFTQKEPNDAKS